MVFRRKRTFRPKRRSFKKRTTKKSSPFARRQQKSAMTWIRKKYTKTFTMDARTADSAAGYTISLIGAKNNQNPNFTITLNDVNQDS